MIIVAPPTISNPIIVHPHNRHQSEHHYSEIDNGYASLTTASGKNFQNSNYYKI